MVARCVLMCWLWGVAVERIFLELVSFPLSDSAIVFGGSLEEFESERFRDFGASSGRNGAATREVAFVSDQQTRRRGSG